MGKCCPRPRHTNFISNRNLINIADNKKIYKIMIKSEIWPLSYGIVILLDSCKVIGWLNILVGLMYIYCDTKVSIVKYLLGLLAY